MNKDSKICILGASGTLGKAIYSRLRSLDYNNIVLSSSSDMDCTRQSEVESFFCEKKPEYVFFLSAISAGIEYKRRYPVEVMLKNLQIETNVLSAAHENGCKRLLNVCSALLYPSLNTMPFKEEDATYMTLNEIDTPYALAKASGFQLCQYYKKEYGDDFFTVVPCNFFGEYSLFEGDKAGVVPSLIRRIHQAKVNDYKEVVVWGTGKACREFLNSKDVASACVFLMENSSEYDLINIGRNKEYSIKETAQTICKVIGYKGRLIFDSTKPEGRLHMQLNTDRLMGMGWRPKLDLEESVADAYNWYVNNL